MSTELVFWLARSALVLGAAIALVLALRPLWLRWLGASSVLWLWLVLPMALLGASLPARTVVLSEVQQTAPPAAQQIAPQLRIAPSVQDIPETITRRGSPWNWLAAAWLLGALWLAARLWRQQQTFRRHLGALRVREDGICIGAGQQIGPAVIGALRPRIVLPADFEQRYDAQQRELVLAHERCHLQRGDLQVNLLLCALRCVYWFNPLVHLAAVRLRLDQELACDAAVLKRHPHARRAYADAMLNTQLADLGLPVGCYWQSSHPLKWRIAMLKHPSPGPGRLLLGASLALIGCSASALSAWAAQPPRIEPVAPAASAKPARSAAPVALAAPAPAASIPQNPAPRAPAPSATARPSIAPAPAAPARPAAAPAARPALAPETPRPIDVSAPLGAFDGDRELAFVAQDIRLAAGLVPLNAAIVSDAGERDSRSSEGVIEITPPRLVESTPPRYPHVGRATRGHYEGIVVLRVDLDAQGSLLSAAVEQSDLPRRFNNQALAAVKHWRFEAALKNGVPVTSTALVPVVFGEAESQDGSGLLANGSPIERYRRDSRRINSAIRSDRHGQVH